MSHKLALTVPLALASGMLELAAAAPDVGGALCLMSLTT
jgi:hypothetical protein